MEAEGGAWDGIPVGEKEKGPLTLLGASLPESGERWDASSPVSTSKRQNSEAQIMQLELRAEFPLPKAGIFSVFQKAAVLSIPIQSWRERDGPRKERTGPSLVPTGVGPQRFPWALPPHPEMAEALRSESPGSNNPWSDLGEQMGIRKDRGRKEGGKGNGEGGSKEDR